MSHAPPVSLTKPPAERSERGDETTRHLCAGVYLDRRFRNLVLRRVLHEPHRRVAPSYGFDLVPVVDHAWRCWVLETTRHACTVALLLIAAWSSLPTALTVVCALGLWGLAWPLLRLAPEVLRIRLRTARAEWFHRYKTRGELNDANRLKEQTRWLKLGTACCGVMAVTPAVSAWSAGVPVLWVLAWSTVFLALIAVVTAMLAAAWQRALNSTRHPGPLRPSRLSRRQEVIDRQQRHPVAVYRRPEPKKDDDDPLLRLDPDDDPNFFVGSGELVHRWLPPLTVQLLRDRRGTALANGTGPPTLSGDGEREFVTPPFQAHELVEHLRSRMKAIGRTSDPTRMPGYQVADRIYFAEGDAPDVRKALTERCAPETLRRIINEPYGPAQYFLEIRTTSSGELVTTVFLRVTVKGRSLSLDFAACALTRTPSRSQLHGRPALHRAPALAVLAALGRLPLEVLDSWRLVTAPWVLTQSLRVRRGGGGWGRSPQVCVREHAAADWRSADFDKPVILDQMKIIELRLLTAVKDFLRSRGVDTSTFEKRAETIISANVLNMGGRVDITNSAVGDSAQVNLGTPVPHGSNDPTVQGAHA
ncbi:hypothetical protein [Actinomadura kijaniata]|uniref:hypothetical protein n=1 Tax=Actinomadura kijaniata TaxID=46161 RepID=UPI0008302A2F|nr:hypothetical protein [Actinomadura kijaniata]